MVLSVPSAQRGSTSRLLHPPLAHSPPPALPFQTLLTSVYLPRFLFCCPSDGNTGKDHLCPQMALVCQHKLHWMGKGFLKTTDIPIKSLIHHAPQCLQTTVCSSYRKSPLCKSWPGPTLEQLISDDFTSRTSHHLSRSIMIPCLNLESLESVEIPSTERVFQRVSEAKLWFDKALINKNELYNFFSESFWHFQVLISK